MKYYVLLEDHTPVKLESTKNKELMIWSEWMSNHENIIVKQEQIDNYKISTVFLGLDHNWYQSDKPLLFETMIFDLPKEEEYQERCSTWNEALIQHAVAVEYAKNLKVA